MGDRSYASLNIHTLPYDTETVEAVADVIEEMFSYYIAATRQADGIYLDYTSTATLRASILTDDGWTDEEADLDFCERCRPLVDLGVTFWASQDPEYEFSGETLVSVPPVGHCWSDSDGEGSPTMTTREVRSILASIDPDQPFDEILADFDRKFGIDVLDAWRNLPPKESTP